MAVIRYIAKRNSVANVSDLYSRPEDWMQDCTAPLGPSDSVWATPGTFETAERLEDAFRRHFFGGK